MLTTPLKFFSSLLLLISINAHASTINYIATDLGGGNWQYDYTVINDSPSNPLFEFTIDFDRTLYENLVAISTPSDWDGLVVQSGSFMDINNGYYDALSLSSTGLGQSDSAGLFSVQFDWLGSSTPAAQAFVIVDPNTFATLDDGFTTLAPSTIPLPAAAPLLLSGLGLLAGLSRLRRRI
jgi:hypothetical protein